MIATVINYCTNDYRYLSFAIAEAKKFSNQVIVVCADHFFNGKKEDRNLLNHSYYNHTDVTFIEYSFDLNSPYGLYPRVKDDDLKGVQYWHSTSRYIGYHYSADNITHVLFLDVDEIPDGERVKEWLASKQHEDFDAVRFTSYFYFRSAKERAKKQTRNALLLKREAINPEILLDVHERRGTFMSMRGDKIEDVRGLDGKPLFHHYSWVKTKKEAHKKSSSWGHKNDRNWKEDINREYGKEGERESIYNFEYEFVEPYCDPMSVKIPKEKISGVFPHVVLTTPSKVLQKSIENLL